MSNSTVMTAKNSFAKGLLMDFSPENTNAESMTSALNATLLTFNGNEGSLQNDMGNGRVETAYLPEGYIPVGSCEFGDIIYIVSYNPLIDKAQIGCFPSPERNLSSDELGQESITVNSSEFQEIEYTYYGIVPGAGWVVLSENNVYLKEHPEWFTERTEPPRLNNPEDVPRDPNIMQTNPQALFCKVSTLTGKLNKSNIRKILYKSNLNSGDQYVITYDNTENDLINITDYGTYVRQLDSLPKLLNIKVVSIEDGKMNILDSNVKWYDLPNSSDDKSYFKFCNGKNASGENVDIDSYRSIVSSAYNTYSSKVSGKLALLIELEKISGFSCGWEAIAVTSTYRYCLSSDYLYLRSKVNDSNEIIWYNSISEIPEDPIYKYIWYQYKKDARSWSDSYYIEKQFNIYYIYLNYSWETNNKNINPKYTILLESEIKDEKGNLISVSDSRYIHDIPEKYSSQNMNFLHKFSRLYHLENINKEYLYDNFINKYLKEGYNYPYNNVYQQGKLTKSGNNVNDNIVSIQHLFENGEYKYELEGQLCTNEAVGVGKYLLNYTPNSNIQPVTISDDVINNTFKMQVRKKLHRFVIPKDAVNLNYHYTICPAMPYGMLEEYSISDIIQLDKLGTTNIQVKDWKYYVHSNLITLTWGLDAYVEPGKNISEVILEFYDNCGIVAAHHAANYNTYNGTFTVNIPMNVKSDILNNITHEGYQFQHAGNIVLGNIEKDMNGNNIPFYTRDVTRFTTYTTGERIGYTYTPSSVKKGTNIYYYDDSGIIYSNLLYLVKIIVKIENKSSTGEYSNNTPLVFCRWLWTNSLFNDQYQKISDFDYLQPTLNLDLHCDYTTKVSEEDGLIKWNVSEVINQVSNLNNEFIPSYHIQTVNGGKKPNIKMIPSVWLTKNYDTFRLNKNYFNDMNVIISFANEYVENNVIQPEIQYYGGVIPGINQILKDSLTSDSHEFELSAELISSQYATDVSLQKKDKSNYLKLTKYGKLV